jgi:hypothetical protein
MSFSLIGHPIAATLAGVALGSTTGFFVADSGLIDFGGGIWNDKLVTGVAYGATIGAVPGVMTGMGNPAMGKARRLAEEKAKQKQASEQESTKEESGYDEPSTARMHPDDAQDFEDFRKWRSYVREREAARYEREEEDDYARGI